MALAGVLSALRVLILDDHSLPDSYEQRLARYSALFPTLTETERQDLAKMPPDKIRIYSTSIFAGEAQLIERKLPLTCSLLRVMWEAHYGHPPRMSALIRTMHANRPWKSTRTEGLIGNFRDFIRYDLEHMGEASLLISELVRYEEISFYVQRAANDRLTCRDSIGRHELAQSTVGEILELHCMLPRYVQFAEFDFDLLNLQEQFFADKKVLPTNVLKRNMYAIAGRNLRHEVRWLEVSEGLFHFLSSKDAGACFSVADLAEQFVPSLPYRLSEEEAFSRFLLWFVDLIEMGGVIVPKDRAKIVATLADRSESAGSSHSPQP